MKNKVLVPKDRAKKDRPCTGGALSSVRGEVRKVPEGRGKR